VLSGGRIQQLDTPRAIYDEPKNSFVATFVGASNLFEGRADGEKFLTGDGIAITHTRPAATGAATALIRPEQFFLAQPGDPSPTLDLDLEQIVFVGSTFELFGRTATGRRAERVTARPARRERPTVADKLWKAPASEEGQGSCGRARPRPGTGSQPASPPR
jgi:ABC-type Fe3+/spermidine/putrescine transport system ATPase subunit